MKTPEAAGATIDAEGNITVAFYTDDGKEKHTLTAKQFIEAAKPKSVKKVPNPWAKNAGKS